MTKTVLQLRLPEFGEVFERFPSTRVRVVDVRGPGPTAALVWMSGGDGDAVGEALDADATVVDWRRLESTDDRTLFRVEFGSGSTTASLYDELVALDGAILEAEGYGGVWEIELYVPSREGVSRFHERARELGARPVLQSVADSSRRTLSETHGLTPLQRETLVVALERGYFSVPKELTLMELAEELGVSDQAASERLRRGMEKLVESTLTGKRGRPPAQ